SNGASRISSARHHELCPMRLAPPREPSRFIDHDYARGRSSPASHHELRYHERRAEPDGLRIRRRQLDLLFRTDPEAAVFHLANLILTHRVATLLGQRRAETTCPPAVMFQKLIALDTKDDWLTTPHKMKEHHVIGLFDAVDQKENR